MPADFYICPGCGWKIPQGKPCYNTECRLYWRKRWSATPRHPERLEVKPESSGPSTPVPRADPAVEWKPILVSVGVLIAIVWGIVALVTRTGDGSSSFAVTSDWGLSPGGRIQVFITVRNTGSETATPSCDITPLDADGIQLSFDFFEGDPIVPGATDRYNVLTGLKVEETFPSDVRVTCD